MRKKQTKRQYANEQTLDEERREDLGRPPAEPGSGSDQLEGDGKEKRKTGQERETRTKRKLWKREEKMAQKPPNTWGDEKTEV